MPISTLDPANLEALSTSDASAERRERTRFKLAYPIRLLRAGRWLGESRTRDINCESFSCVLPESGVPADRLVCGDLLECEIDLVSDAARSVAPSIQLGCQAMVLRVTRLEDDSAEVVCRLLGYKLR